MPERNLRKRKEIQSSERSVETSSISENSESLDEGTTSSELSDNMVQTPIILHQGAQNLPIEEGGGSLEPSTLSESSNVVQIPLSHTEFFNLSGAEYEDAHNKWNDKRLEMYRIDATNPKNDIKSEILKPGTKQPRLNVRSTSKYMLMDDINKSQIYPLDAKNVYGGPNLRSPYKNGEQI